MRRGRGKSADYSDYEKAGASPYRLSPKDSKLMIISNKRKSLELYITRARGSGKCLELLGEFLRSRLFCIVNFRKLCTVFVKCVYEITSR